MAVRALPLGVDRAAWRRAEEAARRSWRLTVALLIPVGLLAIVGPGGHPVVVVGGRLAGDLTTRSTTSGAS